VSDHRRPLIGLTGRRWPVERVPLLPAALAGEEFDLHLSEYPKAVASVGGLPVELTRDADPVDMVGRLDGLVMTGGADLDPSTYGAEPDPALGEIEPSRDRWELALIRAALARRLPMLCICRGAQLLNVAMGGTLEQHLEAPGHAGWDTPRADRCHVERVAAGSRASELYGAEIVTNSLHHQAVDRVGAGLRVTAVADDGVVEAIELADHPQVFAVQWHPEMLGGAPDPAFRWLVAGATAFAAAAGAGLR
jgi:putative glutamine amidotransferase